MKLLYSAILCLSMIPVSFAQCNFGNVYEDLECYEKELQNSKNALNSTYNKLYQSYDDATQQKLEASQKAWLIYRNKYCNEFMGKLGEQAQGAGQALIITSCITDLTRQKNHELQELLE